MDKILGIYEIIDKISENEYLVKDDIYKFYIKKIPKDDKESIYSHKVQTLSSISHKNIISFKIDQDKENFYIIRKEFQTEEFDKLDTNIFLEYNDDIRYQKLIECYLQIFEAIKYIHSQGLYHGNINTDNILVNRQNEVFLLDFGKSYFYGLLDYSDNLNDKIFYSPEQLELIGYDIDTKSDIFSFGICMLKLLLETSDYLNLLRYYHNPNDLGKIFEDIINKNIHKKNDVQNDLFLLIRQMTKIYPEDRISLADLGISLKNILSKNCKIYRFELNLSQDAIKKYKEYNPKFTATYEVIAYIESIIKDKKSYWYFDKEKDGGRNEIRIACGEFVFCCSPRPSPYLFCFGILTNHKRIDEVYLNGLEIYNDFYITIGDNHNSKCDNVQDIKDELSQKFELQQLKNLQLEIDKKAILTEEELLNAEKKTLDQKKNTKLAILKDINRDLDTIIFEFIPYDKGKKNRDFKPKDKVVIFRKDIHVTMVINGEVKEFKSDKEQLIIQLQKYEIINFEKKLDKTKKYLIAYDYQIEEILWNKKNRALEDTKNADVEIPNLLRKINEPKVLEPNTFVEVERFFDSNLDYNQKDAAIKTMSLASGSEILLIQGPPGTGKTTTIVEIVKQLLDRHRHWKILIASQSNQAVDNVLEKIYQTGNEEKILRIGNEEKMSDIARQFTPDKVLDTLIKENINRIKVNSIRDEDLQVETELQTLQKDFDKSLQNITSKLSQDKRSKEYNLATLFIKNIRLVFGTLLGILSWSNFRDITFDIAIIDEAGRATLSELLVPYVKARKIVFVGDHKQLAPVIDDEIIKNLNSFTKEEVTISFFERLFEKLEKSNKDGMQHLEHFKHRLIYNYRAEDKICQLYNQPFYDGELRTAKSIEGKKEHNLSIFNSSVVWLDTSKRDDREDEQKDTGKINKCNVLIIESKLQEILQEMKKNNIQHSIGIITPYKAQVNLLSEMLISIKKDFKEYYRHNADANQDKDLHNGFDIGTVDSFQGSDRDIIIYDCVRSSKSKNSFEDKNKRKRNKINFIADEKRLNVSLSRAKKLLIIVGDIEFLYTASVSEGENPFCKIIGYIQKNKKLYQIINTEEIK